MASARVGTRRETRRSAGKVGRVGQARRGRAHHHPPSINAGAPNAPQRPYTNPVERSREASDAREEGEGHPAIEAAPHSHQLTSPIPSPPRRRRGDARGEPQKSKAPILGREREASGGQEIGGKRSPARTFRFRPPGGGREARREREVPASSALLARTRETLKKPTGFSNLVLWFGCCVRAWLLTCAAVSSFLLFD